MNYQQTLEYLFAQLPMFSRIGAAAYKADLVNTIELCHALGNPQEKFKTIHIAGTNGKGSTSHMLAAVLQQAGYKTGLYTSPHLKDFRERIKIDGAMIPEQVVINFVEKTRLLTEKIQPSFFELTVAMAFDHFAQQEIDIAVIETGLGGRLDSTNIIQPLLSIITNISYDHMNLLGDTLEKIAMEKAGIIKNNIPVVISESIPLTKAIFTETAKEKNAPIHFAEDEFTINNVQGSLRSLAIGIQENASGKNSTLSLDLNGSYQAKNLRAVLSAVNNLRQQGFIIEQDHLEKALANVKLITGLYGRWDLIHEHPYVVLDVGHNEDGVKAILSQLAMTEFNHLHIVMGVVKDKEVEKVLSLLPADASYYFTQAQIPRALDAITFKQKAEPYHLKGESYPEVNLALRTAISKAGNDDLVLVCGSVFVVGEVEPGGW